LAAVRGEPLENIVNGVSSRGNRNTKTTSTV
jgi:hypothetical protein